MNFITSVLFFILAMFELVGFILKGLNHCAWAAMFLFALSWFFYSQSKHKIKKRQR